MRTGIVADPPRVSVTVTDWPVLDGKVPDGTLNLWSAPVGDSPLSVKVPICLPVEVTVIV
jgi:hypothetical protein